VNAADIATHIRIALTALIEFTMNEITLTDKKRAGKFAKISFESDSSERIQCVACADAI